MMKEFSHVVVVTYDSMDYGTEIRRVLPLSPAFEQRTLDILKDYLRVTMHEDRFNRSFSTIEDVDTLIETYEALRATHHWSEGYSFTIKLVS